MTNCQQQRAELMYTPTCHIPIGEPMKTADGTRAMRFKKPGSKETEVVPVETLISMMIRATDKCR